MRQDLVVLAQQLQDAEERALDALKGHRTDDTKSAGMVGTRGTTDLRRGKTSPSCKGTLLNRDVLSLWAVWLIGDRVACGAGSQGDQAQRAQVGDFTYPVIVDLILLGDQHVSSACVVTVLCRGAIVRLNEEFIRAQEQQATRRETTQAHQDDRAQARQAQMQDQVTTHPTTTRPQHCPPLCTLSTLCLTVAGCRAWWLGWGWADACLA